MQYMGRRVLQNGFALCEGSRTVMAEVGRALRLPGLHFRVWRPNTLKHLWVDCL